MKEKEIRKKRDKLLLELKRLYQQMEEVYHRTASKIGLSCKGCTNNCCSTYFQHHTHIEWAYLWKGLRELPQEKRKYFVDRARKYEEEARDILHRGDKVNIMCPLNYKGMCQLYSYRLMICRLHGVPNIVKMPDGTVRHFSGCIRCRELIKKEKFFPVMDRTPFYMALATLERKFVSLLKAPLRKVDHTLAQFLVMGPPH